MATLMNRSLGFYFQLLFPVIIIYGAFFVIRVLGFQPPAEAEMGDFITALFFIFGASISYFIFILSLLANSPKYINGNKCKWSLASYLLILLAYDEIFMIHENISRYFQMSDIFVFAFYGLMLAAVIYLYRSQMTDFFKLFLILFIFLAAVSVLSDSIMGEGYIRLFGLDIDFEQLAESLGALALSSAFVSLALNELMNFKLVSNSKDNQTASNFSKSVK